MRLTRRALLGAAASGASLLAGCGGEPSGSATPPPSTFEVTVTSEPAIELRYTGIGSQAPANFRVVLAGAGAADGAYDLATVTDDTRWTDADRYVLNRTTLDLSAPLPVEEMTVELQYVVDGEWRTLVRTRSAD